MDQLVIVGIIINAALLLVTAAAAVAALVQARVAIAAQGKAETAQGEAEGARDEARRLAVESTEALKASAAELKRANDLRVAESQPDDWTGHHVDGDRWNLTNSSKRAIVVTKFEATPDEAVSMINLFEVVEGATFEYGDGFDFLISHRFTKRVKRLTLSYYFVGEDPVADLHELMMPV